MSWESARYAPTGPARDPREGGPVVRPRMRCVARGSCRFLLPLLILLSPLARPQELIAHPGLGVDSITTNEARLFMTMRLKTWPSGAPVRVFVLPDDDPLHRRFVTEVLGLFPYQLRAVWDRQVFSGTGQAPTTVASEGEMIRRVAATPGSIGYAKSVPDGAGVESLAVR